MVCIQNVPQYNLFFLELSLWPNTCSNIESNTLKIINFDPPIWEYLSTFTISFLLKHFNKCFSVWFLGKTIWFSGLALSFELEEINVSIKNPQFAFGLAWHSLRYSTLKLFRWCVRPFPESIPEINSFHPLITVWSRSSVPARTGTLPIVGRL